MNDAIEDLLPRLKKIAGFKQRNAFYTINLTPDEAAQLVERITAASGTASEKQ